MITVPPYLKQGDTIGIICPSGYMPYEKAKTCIEVLQQWGFIVRVGHTLGHQFNYFSGTDEERLYDLQAMLNNSFIKAILCARGGYGLSRIIDEISFTKFKQNPKWIIGYSDITLLHAHIYRQCKIASIHSPMAAAFNDGQHENEYIQALRNVLSGTPITYTTKPHSFNIQGTCTGELIGGNLAIIAHMIGSKSSFRTDNKILFIEDTGEYLYNIDRMFIQLNRSGMLNNLAGLIIGRFTDMKDTTIPFGSDVYSIIRAHVEEYPYPVCFNFPVGHEKENYPLKIGIPHQLSISSSGVELKEIKSVIGNGSLI